MSNRPGDLPPNQFRPGQSLAAADLNKIVEMLVGRISGGKGVRVRAFGTQIVIDADPSAPRRGGGGTTDKVGYIVSGSGSGPYVVDVHDDGIDQPATEQVDAYPLSGEDHTAGTAVVLTWVPAADAGSGRWYFQSSSVGVVKIGKIIAGTETGPYTVRVYDNGADQAYTDTVSAYPLQIASGEDFPSGLWITLVWVPNADGGSGRWYFQGPVWIDD